MRTLKAGITALALLTTLSLGNLGLDHLGSQRVKKPTVVVKAQEPKKAELYCLARNIYHEARGEPVEGQIAVAHVTLNRVRSKHFQNTVCEVVYAYKQFSWTLDKTKRVQDTQAWEASLKIARGVLDNTIARPHFQALYFHTKQVRPYWKRGKRVVAVIGNHIFYS